jgi:hypothetical protein
MSKKADRLTSALILANVLSAATVTAAYATEGAPPNAGGNNGRASAAPACGYECPVLD